MKISTLLAPIGGAQAAYPAGEDLLYSNDFDIIQEARRFEDPSLDQGEWVTEIKEANWDLVTQRCSKLLETRTKDLRLAVWLTEAMALREGLPGLADGYELIVGLCKTYWDTFYPLPEGDDLEYRLGNVGWLVGRSADILRGISLTDGNVSAYSTLDWETANQIAQALKRHPENAGDIVRAKVTIEQIEAARRASKPDFYRKQLEELARFETAYRDLERELDDRAGHDAPSFRKLKESYEAVRRLAERFARDSGVVIKGSSGAGDQSGSHTTQLTGDENGEDHIKSRSNTLGTLTKAQEKIAGMRGLSAPIASRAQAVAKLREVAIFFRRTEPHSPAAYLADKAAVWAEMPLHEWLQAVMKDGASLEKMNEMLGVTPEKN